VKIIDRENDPEVLREFAKWVITRNEELHAENDKLREEIAQKKQLKLNFEDALLKLRKLIFKKGREKRRAEASDRPRSTEEDSLLVHSQSLIPAPKDKQRATLPEELIYHEIADEGLIKESELRGIVNPSASDWKKVENFYDESSEITLIERKYIKLRHRRQKYKLERGFGDKEVIITAPGPEKLVPGAGYSIDFATAVASDKYINHIPLERQCRQMESLGLKGVTPKTLYNLVSFLAVHLEGVAEQIRKEIFAAVDASTCVHADETPWPINNSKEDNGYMWNISNRAGSYYRFESTRSGDVAKEILKDYKGPVLTDGYRGYNKLKSLDGVTLGHCWAHVRRKFIEIEPNYPDECKEILDLIDKLFVIERQAKSFEELKVLRKNHSKPLIEEIAMWLISRERTSRKESGLKKAIDYTLKLWPGLKLFLDDIRVPLTNNDVERALRHAVMGRKNFYGSRTINGADVAATLYTIIESCKRVELNPAEYMKMAVHMIARGEDPITPLWRARAIRAGVQYPPQ